MVAVVCCDPVCTKARLGARDAHLGGDDRRDGHDAVFAHDVLRVELQPVDRLDGAVEVVRVDDAGGVALGGREVRHLVERGQRLGDVERGAGEEVVVLGLVGHAVPLGREVAVHEVHDGRRRCPQVDEELDDAAVGDEVPCWGGQRGERLDRLDARVVERQRAGPRPPWRARHAVGAGASIAGARHDPMYPGMAPPSGVFANFPRWRQHAWRERGQFADPPATVPSVRCGAGGIGAVRRRRRRGARRRGRGPVGGPARTPAPGGRRSRAAPRAGACPSTAGRCRAAVRTAATGRGRGRRPSGTRSAAPTATPAERSRCRGRGCSGRAARSGRRRRAGRRRTRRSTASGSPATRAIRFGSGPDRNGTTTGTSNSAATSHIASDCMPSAALMTVAPASSARRTTCGRQLSMLTSTPSAASAGTMSARRPHSTDQSTTVAWIGRTLTADVEGVGARRPAARRARATASAGVVAMEPSCSESGLALTTP